MNVVLIMNRIKNRNNMSLQSKNLEFSSNTMFNSIHTALEELYKKVYFYESLSDFIDNIHNHKNDLVISTIWSGQNSRNRRMLLPAICEAYDIKYVGADAYVQALCADKSLAKKYCEAYDIKSAKEIIVKTEDDISKLIFLHFPVIIKPNFEGGSIGISNL